MSRKLKVDMTGVESFTRCPEGEWLARLKKIEMTTTQGGDDALKAQFEVIKGAAKGSSVFETFSLVEKALWKLKSCLEAMGVKADGKINLDLDKLEGKICVIDVMHDEFNGKMRAKINDYLKPEDDDDDDDDDDWEEDVKPSKSKASSKPSKKSTKKSAEPDEEDEEEDEEDEEEEKPVKKPSTTKKKSSAPAKKSQKVAEPEDDDDDDDWEEDDD